MVVGIAVGKRRPAAGRTTDLGDGLTGPDVFVDDGHLLPGCSRVESIVRTDNCARRGAERVVVEGNGERSSYGVVEHVLRLGCNALQVKVVVDILRLDRLNHGDLYYHGRRLLLLGRDAAGAPRAPCTSAVTAELAAVEQAEYEEEQGDCGRDGEQRPVVGFGWLAGRDLAEVARVGVLADAVEATGCMTSACTAVVTDLGRTRSVFCPVVDVSGVIALDIELSLVDIEQCEWICK